MTSIQTEYSLWYLIPCLALAFIYAWLLYQKEAPWAKNINRLLAGVRFVLVALIAMLLLGPYTKILEQNTEKPVVALAIDNSQSLALVNKPEALQAQKTQLAQLSQALEEAGIETGIYNLNGSIAADSLAQMTFDAPASNLNKLLKDIETTYENRQLSGIVLLSDGIYNEGASPSYLPHKTAIHPLGIGDTMPQRDINLRAVYANKIAYLGNKFPLVAELQQVGFNGQEVLVSLMHKGKAIEQRKVLLNADQPFTQVEFLAVAAEKGTQRYIVSVQALQGEFTQQNNSRTTYLDILDSREKILLVAPAPHPDIKAIKAAIEKNENYELDVYIPVLANSPTQKAININDKYDLVIFHQVPNMRNIANDLPQRMMDKGVAIWFILGKQSLIPAFNKLNTGVNISTIGMQKDKVTPTFNQQFRRFTFEGDNVSAITKYPPVEVPFGDYQLAADVEAVLYQRVGSVPTEKPLLALRTSEGKKVAIMLGEGLWQWRLNEFSINQNQNAFDDLVGKLIQFLSTKEDKRRFRVAPTSNEYLNTDRVTFETEAYNDIYEPIYGQQVAMAITNEKGEAQDYSYVNTGPSFRYDVRGLTQGVYRYKATTTLDGATISSEGQFSLRAQELEALHTTADFGMLRQLAKQTGGNFYSSEQVAALQQALIANKAPDIIHSQESMKELLQSLWPLLLLIGLATVEWTVRKIKGGY